jgi:predicted RNase H-like HicB family nuclease
MRSQPDVAEYVQTFTRRLSQGYNQSMRAFTAVIERDPDTGLLVGYVPGFPGAHSQASSMEELQRNLREVIAMLLEDGEPKLEGEFVGTQLVTVD